MKSYVEIGYSFLSNEEVEKRLNPKNPDSPFYGYVGNEASVTQLTDILYSGFHSKATNDPSYCNRNLGPGVIALIGPPSVGKTDLARRSGKCVQLPFVECDQSIKNGSQLFERIKSTCAEMGLPINPINDSTTFQKFKIPPCIVFFDEAQALAGNGEWLLKATEPNDATLMTEKSSIDCKNIFWIFGTTHRGKIPPALDTRIQTIFLHPLNKKEVAQIVHNRYPMLSEEICDKLVQYGRSIPRQCLQFAIQVIRRAERAGNDFLKACEQVATINGVNENGLNHHHINTLKILALNPNKGISLKKLASQIYVAEEDLDNYILPVLLKHNDDTKPLVSTDSRGVTITEVGLQTLNL
jgi:Holliday junction resolvasome RuvABC ATP-dependent DNA helicase subunit